MSMDTYPCVEKLALVIDRRLAAIVNAMTLINESPDKVPESMRAAIADGSYLEKALAGNEEFNAAFGGCDIDRIGVAADTLEESGAEVITMREFEGDISPVCPNKVPRELAERSTYQYLEGEQGYYVMSSREYSARYDDPLEFLKEYQDVLAGMIFEDFDLWPNICSIEGVTIG